MAMTRKHYKMLAKAMRAINPVSRLKLFNELVPELKQDNPRFKVLEFFQACFTVEERNAFEEVSGDDRLGGILEASNRTAETQPIV